MKGTVHGSRLLRGTEVKKGWKTTGVVDIAMRFQLDGPGDRIPVGARLLALVQRSPYLGTWSFPVVKRHGRGLDHPPHLLAPRLKKEQSYVSTSPVALRHKL